MGPYNTKTGNKQRCRSLLVGSIQDKIVPRKAPESILLLPGERAHDARMVRRQWRDIRITGIEEDHTTHDILKRTRLVDTLYLGSVGQYVRHAILAERKQIPFDAAFFDTTNVVLPRDVADICDFVVHLAAPNCILALTYMKLILNDRARPYAEGFVRDHAWLDEEEEDEDHPGWMETENLAGAICGAIDSGYSVPDRYGRERRTRPMANQLKRLDVLEAFSYTSQANSRHMHFILLHIEKF